MSFAWSKVPDISYFQLYRNQSIYLLWKPMIDFFIIKIRKGQQLLLAGLTNLSTTVSLKKYQSIHWNVFWSISQNIEFTVLIINRWQVVQWKHSRFWQISMGNPVELGFYECSNKHSSYGICSKSTMKTRERCQKNQIKFSVSQFLVVT